MNTRLFVNLPVKDLKKSMDFFKKLGFAFNPQFTDENAGCMIIDKDNFAMLIVEEFFKKFTKKEISNAKNTTEVILSLSAESKEMVDEMVNKAFAAGAKPSNEKMEMDSMYGWSFQDLDDHLWEVFYMDMDKIK